MPEGERVTKAAVDINTSREEETKDAVISRFLVHFARFMTTIQKRLCNPEVIDPKAKAMQARLLQIMTREELDELSKQSAVETVKDYTDQERQQIALIAQEGRGNPLYNQYELERQSLTAKVNSDFADRVLLPQNDPTEQAENQREQLEENLVLSSGQPLPVSPRDNHLVHLEVLHKTIEGLIPQAVGNQKIWLMMEQLGNHAQAHLAEAEKAGYVKQAQPYKVFLTKLASTLIKLHQSVQSQPGAPVSGAPAPGTSVAPTGQPTVPMTPIHEAITIAYKDFPEDVKRQIEALLGLKPSTLPPPFPAPTANPQSPATP
jgi:hypothetical protein